MIYDPEFKGRLPKFTGEALPPGYAQVATNCRFEDGVLGCTRKTVKLLGAGGVTDLAMAFMLWRRIAVDFGTFPVLSFNTGTKVATLLNPDADRASTRKYDYTNLVPGVRVIVSTDTTAETTVTSITAVTSQTSENPLVTLADTVSSGGDLVLMDRAVNLSSASTMYVSKVTPLKVIIAGGSTHEYLTGDRVTFSQTGFVGLDGVEFSITVVDDYNMTLDGTTSADIASNATTGNIIFRNAIGRVTQTKWSATFVEGQSFSLDSSWLFFGGIHDGTQQLPRYTVWPEGANLDVDWPNIHTDYPPDVHWPLGVPAPVFALTPTAGEGGTGDAIISRAYVYTHVFIHKGVQMESAPSPAGTVTGLKDGQAVTLTIPVESHAAYYTTGAKLRFYRVAVGNETAEYRFVKEVSYGAASTSDTVEDVSLGEVIPSYQTYPELVTWDMPQPRLRHLVSLPNGIMAGAVDNVIYFCVAYQPHAWPDAYSITTDSRVKALISIDTDLYILTEKGVDIASVIDPSAVTATRINGSVGCLSGKSAAALQDSGVIYAAAEGLAVASRSGALIVTKNVLTKKQWEAYYPYNLSGVFHNGHYYAGFLGPGRVFMWETALSGGSFAFDVERKEWIDFYTGTEFEEYDGIAPVSWYLDKKTSQVCYAGGYGGFYLHDASDRGFLTRTWRSRVYDVSGQGELAVAQVRHDPSVITADTVFKLYSYDNGVSTLRQTVDLSTATNPNSPFAVSASDQWRYVEMEVIGTSKIKNIFLAPSNEDIGRAGVAIGPAS